MLITAPGDEHVAMLDRWYEIEIGWIAWLQNSDATVPFFKWFTDAALHSTLLVSAAVLFLVNWRKGCILLWVYFVGNSVNILLKMTFGTPRPYWLSDQIQAHVGSGSFGFPSGHVFITSSVWITIAYLFPNRWTLIGSGLATLLVAFSRVYLGVHFVIDVVAGVVFALILAWCCSREGFWDRILSNFSLSGQLLFLSLVLLVSSTVWFAWLSIQGDMLPDAWPRNLLGMNQLSSAFNGVAGLIGLRIGMHMLSRGKVVPSETGMLTGLGAFAYSVGCYILLREVSTEFFRSFDGSLGILLRSLKFGVGVWVSTFLSFWLFARSVPRSNSMEMGSGI